MILRGEHHKNFYHRIQSCCVCLNSYFLDNLQQRAPTLCPSNNPSAFCLGEINDSTDASDFAT